MRRSGSDLRGQTEYASLTRRTDEPARTLPPPGAGPGAVKKLDELCGRIEESLERDGAGGLSEESADLLKRFSELTVRTPEPYEFQRYWRSTDKETFLAGCITADPSFDERLTFPEA
ncbi:MAG: hypothetical protein AAF907_15780, partial [Planctomycetota bacterium]